VTLLYSVINAHVTRGDVRGVTPVRCIRMRERAHNFSVHFRVRRGARTVLNYLHLQHRTNDYLYHHATRRITETKGYDLQREILRT
jgi:hypothetical protein